MQKRDDAKRGLATLCIGGGMGVAHDLGIHAAVAPADQLGHGLQAVLLHRLAGGQHDGGPKKGLATLCIGGGMGVATIFEKC